MLTLVHRARQRLFHNELFSQGAHAAAAILAAFILVLLAGTSLLDWRWIALVSTIAVVWAFYIARRKQLTPYRAAQVVDRRMGLADTISTAIYFEQAPEKAAPALRDFQRERANDAAAKVDVRVAVPYRRPRGLYLIATLTLVAGSLFALRYGLLGRLDLHPPIAHMLAQQLGWKDRAEVAKNNRKPPRVPEQEDDPGATVSEPDPSQQMQPDSDEGNDTSNESSAEKGDPTKGDAKKDGNRANQQSPDGDQEGQAETNPSQQDQQTGDKSAKQDQKQANGKPDGANSHESSSLVNKAKDLFQNLLSSLKPPSSNPGDQPQNDPNNQGKGQQKQNDKNGQQKNAAQKGDQSEGQQGEQSEDQPDQSQPSNGKSDSQQASKQPGSGAGNQDGDKRIKQAEDLAAMGKITEILGKRSANLTGEATVEVQSTSQQLKTAYAAGGAQHGQSGGEINRDEVPVAMEGFVQEYFKQARKQAPSAPAASPAPTATPKKQ